MVPNSFFENLLPSALKKWKSNIYALAKKAKEAIAEGGRGNNRDIYKQQLKDIWVCAVNDLS